MEVTPWPAPSMAQELIPTHTAEPGSKIICRVWVLLFFWKFMLWLILKGGGLTRGKHHRTYIVSRGAGSTSFRDTFFSSNIFWTSPAWNSEKYKRGGTSHSYTQRSYEQFLYRRWWHSPPLESQHCSGRSLTSRPQVSCQSKALLPHGRSVVDLSPNNTHNTQFSGNSLFSLFW